MVAAAEEMATAKAARENFMVKMSGIGIRLKKKSLFLENKT